MAKISSGQSCGEWIRRKFSCLKAINYVFQLYNQNARRDEQILSTVSFELFLFGLKSLN